MNHKDFAIQQLGEARVQTPLTGVDFTADDSSIAYFNDLNDLNRYIEKAKEIPAFEKAGPRDKIYHDPAWSKAAIVTAGGLCPGLNAVIKSLVRTLKRQYGVPMVYGIRYGFRGLNPKYKLEPMMLDEDNTDDIHEVGGSILGSSRGRQDEETMVDTLVRMNINMLFCVGGDGTLRCVHDICKVIKKRNLAISVVGVPKTIDNDIGFIDKSFGFETAVLSTTLFISSAHNEAEGAHNGIGLIKVMGRDSGFIAAHSTLANSHITYCLVPEKTFILDGAGQNSLLPNLEKRLEEKKHAVIIVSEGAGQELFDSSTDETDASGNIVYRDIGLFLESKINEYFKRKDIEINLKYFDPSYTIRSGPARGTDAVFCNMLAQNAVHAAMAGRTDMVVGHWHDSFTHVPVQLATKQRKRIDLKSQLWTSVSATVRL